MPQQHTHYALPAVTQSLTRSGERSARLRLSATLERLLLLDHAAGRWSLSLSCGVKAAGAPRSMVSCNNWRQVGTRRLQLAEPKRARLVVNVKAGIRYVPPTGGPAAESRTFPMRMQIGYLAFLGLRLLVPSGGRQCERSICLGRPRRRASSCCSASKQFL